MSDPKPLASLTGGLLARKGDARPAIRRAYVPMTSVAPLPVPVQQESGHVEPDAPAVKDQQARIVRAFAAPARRETNPSPKPQSSAQPKAAFTLRLDADRHLRLRLASAVGNRSAQQIVTEALDTFLAGQAGLDELVAQARQDKR